MHTRETVRAWIQFPMGGTVVDRLSVTNAFMGEIDGHASAAAHDLDSPLSTAVDVTPAADDPLVLTGNDELDRLSALVSTAAETVMKHHPDALITWEALR